jgi:hypothetical protein
MTSRGLGPSVASPASSAAWFGIPLLRLREMSSKKNSEDEVLIEPAVAVSKQKDGF